MVKPNFYAGQSFFFSFKETKVYTRISTSSNVCSSFFSFVWRRRKKFRFFFFPFKEQINLIKLSKLWKVVRWKLNGQMTKKKRNGRPQTVIIIIACVSVVLFFFLAANEPSKRPQNILSSFFSLSILFISNFIFV